MSNLITLDDIKSAHAAIKDSLVKTPTLYAFSLSQKYGCDIFLKLENLQATGSFKCRGALYRLLQLSGAEKKRGVIACSAGNHAQGVAYHATQMGISAKIVMPKSTPSKKVENTEKYGAEVILFGDSFQEAHDQAHKICKEEGRILIPPFDDPHIITGQGTIGLELFDQDNDFDEIIVPIGGGGLISGIATACKEQGKKARIVGVQSKTHPTHYNAFYGTDEPSQGTTIAEGIAVKTFSDLTKNHIKTHVDAITLASENAIENAIYDLMTVEKIVAEGAGAAALAPILEDSERYKGKKVCLIICGGNIDQSLMTTILTRGMMAHHLYTILRFESEDKPGFLASITKTLADENINIVEVHHNRLFKSLPVKKTHIDITIETRGRAHAEAIESLFSGKGFKVKVINAPLQ